MILMCGIPSEHPLAMVAEELEALGARYAWFDQRRFDEMRVDVRVHGDAVGGTLHVNGSAIALESVRGAYTRMMDHRLFPELRAEGDSPRARRCAALHEAMSEWLEIAPARVVNRAAAMASNGSKPFQSQLIREHGFSIPETLITNDPELVHEFRARHGTIVYKSISGIRSIVRALSHDDLRRLDAIRWCPTQFQQFVPGTNIRVHVVGDELFATAAETTAVDYRYASQEGGETQLVPVTLPDELGGRCITLAAALGLEFAGIDLKRTDDGEVYCFEVNPSPGFSYFESHTGQRIAHAVARRLMS